MRLVKQLRGTGTSTISKTSTCTAMLTCRRVGRPMTIACQQSAALIFTGEPRPRPHDEDDESRRFASCLAGGACVSIYVHRAFAEGECACRRNSTRSRSPWRSQRWRWWRQRWRHVQRWQQWQGKWWCQRWRAGCRKGPRRWQFSSRVAIDHRKSVRRRPIKQPAEEQVSAAPAAVSCDALALHRRMVRTASHARRTETGVAGSRVKWRWLDRRAGRRAADAACDELQLVCW